MEIISLTYIITRDSNLTDAEKQNLIDKQSREMNTDFNPPSGLSPQEYSTLFVQKFMKDREVARNTFDDFKIKIRVGEDFQIGNSECIKRIYQIESSPDFHSWENLPLVEYYKELSKHYE